MYMLLFQYISLAICEPACLNGGQCDSPNQCTCTAEYKGSLCEEGVVLWHDMPHSIVLMYSMSF